MGSVNCRLSSGIFLDVASGGVERLAQIIPCECDNSSPVV